MNIIYSNSLSVENYCLLRKSVGFHDIPEKLVKSALERSDYIITAVVNNKTIGMARLITDGTQVLIMDVVVHPDYQRKGIGKNLMEKIIEYVKSMEYTQMFVQLITDKIDFYEKLGFNRASSENAEGMYIDLYKNNQ